MRVLGYILLVLGFVFLALPAASSRKFSIQALGHHLGELPAQETFTRAEVETIIRKVTFYGAHSFSEEMVAPLLMLSGGILLDRAKRRHKDANRTA